MAMNFRDHPLMTRTSGMKTWPPRWSSTGRDKKDWPRGEVGTLQQAWLIYISLITSSFDSVNLLYDGL